MDSTPTVDGTHAGQSECLAKMKTAKYDKTMKDPQKPFHHQMAFEHHIIFTGKDAGDRKTLVFG